MSEPSPGEIMRRLDEVSRQLVRLAAELRADRIDAASTYVRKDVYAAEQATLRGDVDELQKVGRDRDKSAADTRRQLIVGICLAVAAALISLIVSLVMSGGIQ